MKNSNNAIFVFRLKAPPNRGRGWFLPWLTGLLTLFDIVNSLPVCWGKVYIIEKILNTWQHMGITKYYTKEDRDKILAYLRPKQEHWGVLENPRNYLLARYIFESGSRISEPLGQREIILKFKHNSLIGHGLRPVDLRVELDAKTGMKKYYAVATILKQAKKTEILKLISAELYDMLHWYADHYKLKQTDPFFPISRQRFAIILKNACEKSDVPFQGIHAARRTVGRSFVKNPKFKVHQLSFLQKHVYGHSRKSSTMEYLDFLDDEESEQIVSEELLDL